MANRTVAVNFTANTAQYTTGVGKAALATGGLSSAAMSVTRSLIGPGALIFALTSAVKWANATEEANRNFNQELLKLQTQVGLTTDEMNSMGQAALSLAGSTTKAPQELAEAMFFIASAGLRGAAAMDVLRSSARLSAVGLGETKTIADLLTSAVNAYGVEALSAASASDTLINAVRLGKLEADSLAGSMGSVLPIAAAMGVTFEEVGGIMAAMSKTGTNAAEASTQLRAIMVSLLSPSEQANAAMTELGFTQEGLRRVIMEDGLFQALMVLRDATGGNAAAFAELFPNIRALGGVMDLMGPQLQGNIDLMNGMAESAGLADEAFALYAESAGASVERLQAEQERLAILQGEYQVGVRAFIRERRTMLAQSRADTIAFSRDSEGMADVLLSELEPALRLFAAANFASTEEMKAARAESTEMNYAMSFIEETMLRLAQNTDLTAGKLDMYTLNALGGRDASLEQMDAVMLLIEALMLQGESIPTDAMNDYTGIVGDAASAEGDLAGALGFTNDELLDQIDLLRDRLDVQLRLLDPVYNAIQAERDYAEATAEVNRLQADGNTASEDYVDALFEQEFAFLRMTSALGESDTVMPNFIEHLNTMITDGRLTADAVQIIIDRINEQGRVMLELDGTEVKTKHTHTIETIMVGVDNAGQLSSWERGMLEGRARGGPVSAGQPYIVGEEGPELIIPRGAGTVLPAGQTAAAMSGGTYNVQVHMPPGADGNQVVEALRRWERSNGPVPIGVR